MKAAIGVCVVLGGGLLTISPPGLPARSAPAPRSPSPFVQPRDLVRFEANHGQADTRVRFLARGKHGTLYLTRSGAELALRGNSDGNRAAAAVVKMDLLGARGARPTGEDLSRVRSHYFYGGANPEVAGVTHYARVRYPGLYPGIDLLYYGGRDGLEFDFLAAPGADPHSIGLRFSGMERLGIDETSGDLVLQTAAGQVRLRRPVAYQAIKGKRVPVECAFTLGQGGEGASFKLGAYDPSHPLVIDPVLDFATYLGGSGAGDEYARAVAVSEGGNRVYVTGDTASLDFPALPNPPRWGRPAGQDVFVSCIDANGELRWTTFLIGSGTDVGLDIALDRNGYVCVTGQTSSPDFPLRKAIQWFYGGGSQDGFLARLSKDGQRLHFSTFVGGPNEDGGFGVAVDRSGDWWALLAAGPGLPTSPDAAQPAYGGGTHDSYLLKLGNPGSTRPRVLHATYIGGSDYDPPGGLGLDDRGNVYAAGNTLSGDFPTTAGAFQPTHAGLEDNWAVKVPRHGGAFLYSSYVGGQGIDYLFDLAVHNGEAYLGGANIGGSFPTTPGSFQPAPLFGLHDGTVARLNRTGTALVYSTYIATPDFEAVRGIAVDRHGHAWLGIETDAPSFPTVNATQSTYGGGASDAAVAVLDPIGASLVQSTFVGGSGLDRCFYDSIAVGHRGAYFAGQTDSTDFPVQEALQSSFGGGIFDAFVVHVRRQAPP